MLQTLAGSLQVPSSWTRTGLESSSVRAPTLTTGCRFRKKASTFSVSLRQPSDSVQRLTALYGADYVQRSLEDCERKFHVVSGTRQDWRTRDGLDGCAHNYVPTDHDLADPAARRALEALPHGDLVLQRPDGWNELFIRDTSARDSWQGRMTRAIVNGWREQSLTGPGEGWFWEQGDEASEESLMGLDNVWLIADVQKATVANAVLSDL